MKMDDYQAHNNPHTCDVLILLLSIMDIMFPFGNWLGSTIKDNHCNKDDGYDQHCILCYVYLDLPLYV